MKRLWSYLPSSLSSSRSDPPQQIPDPTGDPPAAKAGDTPALLQEPPPALQGVNSGLGYLSTCIHALRTSSCY